MLSECRGEAPHGLKAVDITDEAHGAWFDRYKYDIPVLHVDGAFMAKHRLSREEAVASIGAAAAGNFAAPPGEPNAAKHEASRVHDADTDECKGGNCW